MQESMVIACRLCLLAAVSLLAPASAALGLVISRGDGQGNTNAPTANPGWNNVAHLSSASAVYLGNRWFITANHVSNSTSLTLADGRSIALVPGSDKTLTNPTGLTGTPDLRLVQLAEDPGLPSLTLADAAPKVGTALMMIGTGFDRGTNLTGWRNLNGVFEEERLPVDSLVGYGVQTTAHMRWGTNQVQSNLSVSNSTVSFSTQFDRRGLPSEAQATVGDSGGGVFQLHNGVWELTGIMLAVRQVSGQQTLTTERYGSSTVVYGEGTIIANLATYREQIEAILATTTQQSVKNGSESAQSLTDTATPLAAMLSAPADALTLLEGANASGAAAASPLLARSLVAVQVPEPGANVLAALGGSLAAVGIAIRARRPRARQAA